MDIEDYNDTVRLAAKRLEYFGRLGVRYVPFSMPAPPVSEGERALKALQATIKACELCIEPLKKAHVVMGEGRAEASVVFVVGAPAVATASGGSLMQGRDMELLQKIIKAMELDEDDVYITAVVKCVSPSGRRPQKADIKRCLPHLNKELELISPKVIIALGSEAAEMIVPRDGDSKYKADYRGIKVVPVAHPSEMNRRPELKAGAWKELQGVMEFLKEGKVS
jgi:DNA polymerase